MTKILVLYYSMYGHVEIMAEAVAAGARSIDDVEVSLKRVPEIMPEEVARKAGAKLDQPAYIATVHELPDYDAIIFGTRPALAICARRCATSWIRPVVYG